MYIKHISSGENFQVEITPVEICDFKKLNISRYFFNCSKEKEFEVYRLTLIGSNDILGLISLERIPVEWRIHIRLLTVSAENRGVHKLYDRIAGNLIAFAAKIAVFDYAELACLSLRPKNRIAQHYITKYNMSSTGLTISIETPEIIDLINQYDHE